MNEEKISQVDHKLAFSNNDHGKNMRVFGEIKILHNSPLVIIDR